MTEYEITTHPDGKQFIRIEDKWMPLDEAISIYKGNLRLRDALDYIHRNSLTAVGLCLDPS